MKLQTKAVNMDLKEVMSTWSTRKYPDMNINNKKDGMMPNIEDRSRR